MNKKILLIPAGILVLLGLLFSGCIIGDPAGILGYGTLLGPFDLETSGSNSLTVYNDTSSDTISSIKAAVTKGTDEPDWSGVTSTVFTLLSSGSMVSGGSASYTIGTVAENIHDGLIDQSYIWIKVVTATGDYFVGGFFFTTGDHWGLHIENIKY
jgi:hypothetical protein